MAAVGSYAMVAPLFPYILADIGPSDSIIWVALANQLGACVMYLLCGRLSDVFGRRWFFITGSFLGLIGSIIGATAPSVNALIAAQVFTGLAAGFQLSSFWVLSEIVPMKFRLAAVSSCYIFSTPSAALGSKISLSIQLTSVHWRGVYYFLIGANAVSTLCWFFFYHPPTYKMLHRRTAVMTLILRFDWIGLILFVGSLLIFLLGLTWGGSVYPWKSGQVIGTLVGGAVAFIIFIVWEIYLPIGSEPYLPLKFFANGRFQCCAWIAAIGSSVFYAYALIWPMAVAVLYSEQDDSYKATISSLTAMGIVFGQILGGYFATFVGPKWGTIVTMYISVPLLAAAAYNPLNMNLTMGLITAGCLFIGMMESIVVTASTFPIKTQEEIGTAGGLAGTIRVFGSTIATAILSTTLTSRLADTIPQYVVPAVSNAGLPATSIPALISGLGGLTTLNTTTVPGLTDQIVAVGAQAYKVAHSEAFKTVFLANLAFGGCGLILCWFILDRDPSKDDFVAAHLHKVKDKKALEKEVV